MVTNEMVQKAEQTKFEWRTIWISGLLNEISAYWSAQPTSKDKEDAERYIRTIQNSLANRDKMVRQFAVVQLEMASLKTLTNHEIAWQNHQNDPDKLTIRKARSTGGTTTAEMKAAEKAEQMRAVFELFDKLNMPERNRAAIIAERLGITARTVRTYLKEKKRKHAKR